MGVIPVTTVITRLRYGPKEKAIVKYFDDKILEIELGEVEEYISELKNQANQKNVEIVDIELLPSSLIRG